MNKADETIIFRHRFIRFLSPVAIHSTCFHGNQAPILCNYSGCLNSFVTHSIALENAKVPLDSLEYVGYNYDSLS